jgi:hypothetical protein
LKVGVPHGTEKQSVIKSKDFNLEEYIQKQQNHLFILAKDEMFHFYGCEAQEAFLLPSTRATSCPCHPGGPPPGLGRLNRHSSIARFWPPNFRSGSL